MHLRSMRRESLPLGSRRAVNSRPHSTRFSMALLGVATLVSVAIVLAPSSSLKSQEQPVAGNAGKNLALDQDEIREVSSELHGRMNSVAEDLRATQPDDSRRIDEATQQVRTLEIEKKLVEIQRILQGGSFLSAVQPQEELIKRIHSIIDTLEGRKHGEESPKDLDRKIEKVREALKNVSELKKKQKSLLEKMRDFLSGQKLAEQLSQMKDRLLGLEKQQDALNSDKMTPELERLSRQDGESLGDAIESLRRLENEQRQLNEQLDRLARENAQNPQDGGPQQNSDGAQSSMAAELEKMLRDLKDGEARARELLKSTENLKARASDNFDPGTGENKSSDQGGSSE